MRHELPRIALATLLVDAVVAVVCVAICALFFSVSVVAVGSALFAASLLLGLAAGGTGANPMGGFPPSPRGTPSMATAIENEMLAGYAHRNMSYELARMRSLSCALIFGIAAVPLFAASALLLVGMSE